MIFSCRYHKWLTDIYFVLNNWSFILLSQIKESSSLKEVNQSLSQERGQIQRQREMEVKEKAREREHSEKYRKEVSEVIHKVKGSGAPQGCQAANRVSPERFSVKSFYSLYFSVWFHHMCTCKWHIHYFPALWKFQYINSIFLAFHGVPIWNCEFSRFCYLELWILRVLLSLWVLLSGIVSFLCWDFS